jgi:hypothetical protein
MEAGPLALHWWRNPDKGARIMPEQAIEIRRAL